MIELFSRRDEAYFARTLGINNLRAHFGNLEKDSARSSTTTSTETESRRRGAGDPRHETRRSRSSSSSAAAPTRTRARYARRATRRCSPSASPRRSPSTRFERPTASCSTTSRRHSRKTKPLFSLAIYYPLAYYKGADKSIDPLEKNRQYQVVGLIRTNFLKRFESSVWAFELSSIVCSKAARLRRSPCQLRPRQNRLDRWRLQNEAALEAAAARQLSRGVGPRMTRAKTTCSSLGAPRKSKARPRRL